MKYRADIDGLRAIAVLPVLFFHTGLSVFSGGYVGVDVFFVISGYVIAMSLLGVAPGYAVLALLLMVTGLSSASLHAVAPVIAGNLSGRSLGRGMGFWMVGGEMGRVLGPIVIVTAVGLFGLRGTPWLMTGGLAASAILYLRLRDIPGRPGNARRPTPWRRALQAMKPVVTL